MSASITENHSSTFATTSSDASSVVALFAAVEAGDMESLKGCTHLLNCRFGGLTTLYRACEKNDLKVIEYLLNAGADPNLSNEVEISYEIPSACFDTRHNEIKRPENTPLCCAVSQGHVDLMNLLIAHSAAFHQTGSDGVPPVVIAARTDQKEVMLSLIDQEQRKISASWGGSITCASHAWETLLNEAVHKPDLLEVLLNSPVHIFIDGRSKVDELTPLARAITGHHFASVRLLIEAGADITLLYSGRNIFELAQQMLNAPLHDEELIENRRLINAYIQNDQLKKQMILQALKKRFNSIFSVEIDQLPNDDEFILSLIHTVEKTLEQQHRQLTKENVGKLHHLLGQMLSKLSPAAVPESMRPLLKEWMLVNVEKPQWLLDLANALDVLVVDTTYYPPVPLTDRVLHAAISSDGIQGLSFLEGWPEDVLKRSIHSIVEGQSTLYRACIAGKVDVAEFLLIKGLLPNQGNQTDPKDVLGKRRYDYPNSHYRNTPLHAAVQIGHRPLAELLLQFGASLNQPGLKNYPPLLTSIIYREEDFVLWLIQKGADIPTTNRAAISNLGQPLLSLAAGRGLLKTVDILLAMGLNPLELDQNGSTVLHRAISYSKMLSFLLKHGGMPALNTPDKEGISPLMIAVQRAELSSIKLLVKAGAYLRATYVANGKLIAYDVTKEVGTLPQSNPRRFIDKKIATQVVSNYFKELMPQFIVTPGSISARIQTRMQELVQSPSAENFQLTDEQKRFYNRPDSRGYTPLMYAACSGDLASVGNLVQKGALIKATYLSDGKLVSYDVIEQIEEDLRILDYMPWSALRARIKNMQAVLKHLKAPLTPLPEFIPIKTTPPPRPLEFRVLSGSTSSQQAAQQLISFPSSAPSSAVSQPSPRALVSSTVSSSSTPASHSSAEPPASSDLLDDEDWLAELYGE